jgi:hypothetical protein
MPNDGVKKNNRNLLIIIMSVLLLTAGVVSISVMVSEDVFARDGRYSGDSTSQAAAVSNDCLNPIFDSNTIDNAVGVANCGGTVSQQDESGQASAPITHQTANPTIELQRATTQPPLTITPEECEDCFNVLSPSQLATFVQGLPGPPFDPQVRTIEQLCEFIRNHPDSLGDILEELVGLFDEIGVSDSDITSILNCVRGRT